mmetsp:Transcript_23509/g.39905  ORF Transcript_23509/g.39905 Transcript_23509/m.39905 type:complete len:624 (-) Transcript_23509:2555-4426(-)
MKVEKQYYGRRSGRTHRDLEVIRADVYMGGTDEGKDDFDIQYPKRRRSRKRKKKKEPEPEPELINPEPEVEPELDPPVPGLNIEEEMKDDEKAVDLPWPHPDASYDECLLCCETISPSYSLSCGHTYCHNCTLGYLTSTLLTPKKKIFTGLFCFYRCGCSFLTTPPFVLQPEMREKVVWGLKLMEDGNKLIVEKAAADGLVTDVVRATCNNDEIKILEWCKSKYSIYKCCKEQCENYFAVRNVCGPADDNEQGDDVNSRGDGDDRVGDDDEEGGLLCDACTVKGGAREHISVWRPIVNSSYAPTVVNGSSLFCQELTDEDLASAHSCVCDTDDNASAQQIELEIIQAIYPDLVDVIVPTPTTAGDRGAYFTVRIANPSITTQEAANNASSTTTQTSRVQSNILLKKRLSSELVLHVWYPEGYPSCSPPVVRITMGSLSLADMNIHRKNQLYERIVSTLQPQNLSPNQGNDAGADEDSTGVYNCVKSFADWIGDFEMNRIALRAQQHRLHICEKILTLRCPRCSTAILDFDGCFALVCNNCSAGFCGWCMRDCGADAHDHVLECSANYHPGDYFGPFSDFMRVHNLERQRKVDAYITSAAVEKECRAEVVKAIKGDLIGLNITV